MTITIPDVALRSMWRRLPDIVTEDEARAACLAMLENWPGMLTECDLRLPDGRLVHIGGAIILPMPQEASDE